MATFQAQVQGLTGLTISSSGTAPTEAELNEFLKDGVIDVTNRCIAIDPNMIEGFLRKSDEQTSNGFDVGTQRIISVVREAGVANDWRECTKIPIGMQSRATDSNSLYFSSKYNPSYFIEQDTEVSVLPDPAGSAVNGFRVYYVNNVPIDETNSASLTYAHSDIKYFPIDRVYLVVIYAGIKSLENAMSAKGIPTVAGDGAELTSVDDLDTDNTIDVHADQIEIDQWWSTAGHLIEGEEDTELATVQLQKIQSYIQAYTAQLQGNSADYQWMQARHQILSQQYNLAFNIGAPKQEAKAK